MLKKFKYKKKTKPFALICKTIKGYPIKFMMNVPMWHYRSPNNSEYISAKKILKEHYNLWEISLQKYYINIQKKIKR